MRRGFVIQLSPEADPGKAKFTGRVEHVDSGRAGGFRSAEELIRFIEQTVKDLEEAVREEVPEQREAE